ncbi:actin family [Pelagophyceae sp. CCMP2097]|nr:actin family [Pelagophyceae sp. CCMP2097]
MSLGPVVLDNGSWRVRCGFAEGGAEPRIVAPNCTGRPKGQLKVLVADEIYALRNLAQLEFQRPLVRGFFVDAGCEFDVWRRLVESASGLGVPARDSKLLCTEPALWNPSSQRALDELIFEDMEFQSAVVKPAPCLAALDATHAAGTAGTADDAATANGAADGAENAAGPAAERPRPPAALKGDETLVVVDLGHSATHVVPTVSKAGFHRAAVSGAVRRLDVGGQLLTGYLREMVSYRQYNMMDEGVVLDKAKCALGFVSPNVKDDLKRCDGTTVENAYCGELYAEYVLPDYHTIQEGHCRFASYPPAKGGESLKGEARPARQRRTRTDATPQFLRLESERFCVPEILFSPMDLGLSQAGLHELVADALRAAEAASAPKRNVRVVLAGGGANLYGLEARLFAELRPLLPHFQNLSVETSRTPEHAAYRGGAIFAAHASSYDAACCTRAQYLEHGARGPRDVADYA